MLIVIWLTIYKDYNNFSRDTLTLYDGDSDASSLLTKHCGGSIPPTYYSQTNMAFIHFQTDGSVTGTGFELEYTPSSKLCSIFSWIWVENTAFQIFDLTAIDWLRQEELQEVPPKNGYFQIDGWI